MNLPLREATTRSSPSTPAARLRRPTAEAEHVLQRGPGNLRRGRKRVIESICQECKQQIGLEATREAHPNLHEPPEAVLHPDFPIYRFQRLYVCCVCPTVLSRGRNTGWTAAFSLIPRSTP